MKPKIRDIRKNKGIIQTHISKQTGIKQQQLSKWEQGKSFPRVDKAFMLAKVLGVKVDDLYDEE